MCARKNLWLYALMSTAGDDAEAEDAETENARIPALGGTASIVSLHDGFLVTRHSRVSLRRMGGSVENFLSPEARRALNREPP